MKRKLPSLCKSLAYKAARFALGCFCLGISRVDEFLATAPPPHVLPYSEQTFEPRPSK